MFELPLRPAVGSSRRCFLRRAFGRGGTVTLSCARLYVRYVDAAAANDLDAFERSVRTEIGPADEVRLAEREWLARDEFRRALIEILQRALPEPPRRPIGSPSP